MMLGCEGVLSDVRQGAVAPGLTNHPGGDAMRVASRCLVSGFVAGWLLLVGASAAHAQSAIAGVVRDTTGAVLPGVTVEAASPVLIERVRSVSTDAQGQYKKVMRETRFSSCRPHRDALKRPLPDFVP